MNYIAAIVLALTLDPFTSGEARMIQTQQSPTTAEVICCKTWRWVESFDPYRGGEYSRPSPKSVQHIFIFGADGCFVEDLVGGCCRTDGTWSLSDDKKILKLKTAQPGSKNDRIYEIRELSPRKLKLAWQGQHSMVIETYVPDERLKPRLAR